MNMAANTGAVNHGDVTIERIDPRLLTGEPTYLFNIYGVEHMRNTGTTGMYYIPPCPEDKEYIRSPHTIPGTVVDTFAQFDDKERYRALPTFGDDIVTAVIKGGNATDDISNLGVFASKNTTPSKIELRDANEKLNRYLSIVVQEADRFSASAQSWERESISDKHFLAARRLRLKRSWMTETTALSACPFCSTPVNPGVPKCPNCHEVINAKAYAELKASIGA